MNGVTEMSISIAPRELWHRGRRTVDPVSGTIAFEFNRVAIADPTDLGFSYPP